MSAERLQPPVGSSFRRSKFGGRSRKQRAPGFRSILGREVPALDAARSDHVTHSLQPRSLAALSAYQSIPAVVAKSMSLHSGTHGLLQTR